MRAARPIVTDGRESSGPLTGFWWVGAAQNASRWQRWLFLVALHGVGEATDPLDIRSKSVCQTCSGHRAVNLVTNWSDLAKVRQMTWVLACQRCRNCPHYFHRSNWPQSAEGVEGRYIPVHWIR